MKKFLFAILLFSFCLSGCGNNNNVSNSQEEKNNYSTSRISATDTTNNIDNTNTNSNIEIKNNVNTEIELSSFSTKIYTPDDEARQNNIRITCSKLNGTIVKSRRNFFFL